MAFLQAPHGLHASRFPLPDVIALRDSHVAVTKYTLDGQVRHAEFIQVGAESSSEGVPPMEGYSVLGQSGLDVLPSRREIIGPLI